MGLDENKVQKLAKTVEDLKHTESLEFLEFNKVKFDLVK